MDQTRSAVWSRWRFLLFLLPAVLVAVLVSITLPRTAPQLEAIPERLELLTGGDGPSQAALTLPVDVADGVYTGSARGFGGPITVEVTVKDRRITAVEIVSAAGETENYFRQARRVLEAVYEKQTWEVDVVSGATYSSRGILGAIQNALTGETVNNPAPPQANAGKRAAVDTFDEPAAYRDGVYRGTAQGFGGDITVEVTISGGRIAAINVVSASGETQTYLTRALSVVSAMRNANSPNVDTVSGATFSSAGIINATKRALRQAAADPDSPAIAEPADPAPVDNPDAMPEKPLADGVYTGTGEGFGGDITVQVTVSGGRITAVEIVSADGETAAYLNRAKALLPKVLGTQGTHVDAVSGATYSSKGILEAIDAALRKAAGEDAAETPQPSEPPTPSDPPDEPESPYADGVYTASAWCDDGEDFRYQIVVTITITDGRIAAVHMERGLDESDDPSANDVYYNRALNGATRNGVTTPGIPAQIVSRQTADGIDAVSRATYTSNAAQAAARQALAQATAAKNGGGASG